MQSLKPFIARIVAVMLAFVLCGAPELAQAAQQSAGEQTTPESQGVPSVAYPAAHNQQSQTPSPSGTTVDPSQGPLEPIPPSTSDQNLPEAPSAQPAQPQVTGTPQAPPVPTPNAPAAQKPSEPVGTATAESTPTAGGAASKPAGTAIAPAKQRQVRSLLIKLGAVAGAAVALGAVMALSQKTPSVPPGANQAPK